MAGVVRLDGSSVEGAGASRDETVAKILSQLAAMNDAGRVKGLLLLYLTPEGASDTQWAWPATSGEFPWYLAMHGALSLLRAEMEKSWVDSPSVSGPPDPAA